MKTGHIVRPDGTINTGRPDTGHGEAMPLHLTGEAQHTPGPWIVNGLIIEASADGEYLAPICECDHEWSDGASEANARLIAAAPELLEVLKAVDYHSPANWTTNPGQWIDVRVPADMFRSVKAAIAKATEGQKS